MIDYLRGQIAHTAVDSIVIDVRGVGYRVFCANPYAFEKQGTADVVVYIHHHVREDAILLFGFATRDEQELFRKLLDVSGVGPRVAIGVLAGARPAQLISAIRREDLTYLTKLPGIGKKTAQRMILDLKDKLGEATYADDGGAQPEEAYVSDATGNAAWREAKEGLQSLGFSAAELDRIWPTLKNEAGEGALADVWMKLALKHLYKG